MKTVLTRQRILDSAQEYFLKYGFKDSLVGDIADSAQIERRTVYRYFEGKDDLLLRITISLFQEFTKVIFEHNFTSNYNAYQKIEELLSVAFNHIQLHPEMFICLGMIDTNISSQVNELEPFIELSSFGKELDTLLTQLIIAGQEDGSIKKIHIPQIFALTITNSLTALATRTAIYYKDQILSNHNFQWNLIKTQGMIFLDSLRCDHD